MKSFFVLFFLSFNLFVFSQDNNKMKYENGKILFNGEAIKLKKAKELAKEKSPEALKYFKIAQIYNINVLTFTTAGFISLFYEIRKDIKYGYDYEGLHPTTIGWACVASSGWFLTFSNRSKIKGIQAFNES